MDNGITLYPGERPVEISEEDVGNAFREEVRAIAATGAQNVGFVDVFKGE